MSGNKMFYTKIFYCIELSEKFYKKYIRFQDLMIDDGREH